jgi:hypothetical protein
MLGWDNIGVGDSATKANLTNGIERNTINEDKQIETKKGTEQSLFKSEA